MELYFVGFHSSWDLPCLVFDMASSSIAKQNLNAVIASQIRYLDDHDRQKQTTLVTSEDGETNHFPNNHCSAFPLPSQFTSDIHLAPKISPSVTELPFNGCHFDSNNNSLPNGLIHSIISVCHSQSPQRLTSKQAQLQRKSRSQASKRQRDFTRESQASPSSDVSSSSSPSSKRRKSPTNVECHSGLSMIYCSSSTTPSKCQQNQLLLPDTTAASSATTVTLPYETTVTGKKKGTKGSLGASGARRNERERNRVKQVNLGFDKLREHVPQGRQNKKLSKVDTLKAAVSYIQQLQQILGLTEEFLTNSHNFANDHELEDKIIDEEHFDEDSDNDNVLFKSSTKSINNGFDYNDGLTVLADASSLAEKENMFADASLEAETKQALNTDYRPQANMTEHFYAEVQSNLSSNDQFIFQGNALMSSNGSSKMIANELQLEELISSLSSQQQNELIMGALKVDSIQVARNKGGDATNAFAEASPCSSLLDNFMVCQQKPPPSDMLVTGFQPPFDHLSNQQTSEKLGSLLEVLLNDNVEDLLLDFRSNEDSHFRQQFNSHR